MGDNDILADEINGFTASMSNMLDERARQVRRGIDSFGASLQLVSDRLSSMYSRLTSILSPDGGGVGAPAGSPRSGTTGGGNGSVQLVQVVNTTNQLIPVRTFEGQRRQRGGFLGGVGSFFGGIFGGLIGGIVGGIAMPIALVAIMGELVVALGLAIPLVRNARRLVADIRGLANELLTGIRGLIQMLFRELTAAGIFPVSRLLTSILVFIDYGLTLIMRHIEPVMNWLMELLQGLNNWIVDLVTEVSRWLSRMLNSLPPYLTRLIDYLVEGVLRPALAIIIDDAIRALVISLTGVAFGAAYAIGQVLMEAGRWLADTIHRKFVLMVNEMIGMLNSFIRVLEGAIGRLFRELGRIIPGLPTSVSLGLVSTLAVPAAPEGLGARIAREVPAAYQRGRTAGRSLMEGVMGPPAPSRSTEPPTAPTFGSTPFNTQEMDLPEFPRAEPLLERLLGRERQPASRQDTTPPSTGTRRPTQSLAPVTFNGGVNVQITAESIDRENAQATARRIAESVMEEIERISERNRFRRGLITSTVV